MAHKVEAKCEVLGSYDVTYPEFYMGRFHTDHCATKEEALRVLAAKWGEFEETYAYAGERARVEDGYNPLRYYADRSGVRYVEHIAYIA